MTNNFGPLYERNPLENSNPMISRFLLHAMRSLAAAILDFDQDAVAGIPETELKLSTALSSSSPVSSSSAFPPSLRVVIPQEHPLHALSRAEVCLANIDHQISLLQDAKAEKLCDIEERRKRLNMLSILNRLLSDDLLNTIFTHLVHEESSRYPWLLASVCRRWREVCLENSTLWSEIRIGQGHICGEDLEDYHSSDVLRIFLQLERSKLAHLHVNLDAIPCKCPAQLAKLQAVLSHSSRWETFKLQIPRYAERWTEAHVDTFRDIIPADASFPNLQDIHWQPSGHLGYFAPHLFALPFPRCQELTSLRRLSLLSFSSTFDVYDEIPWRQLRYLELACSGYHRELLSALRKCKHLTTLKIAFTCGEWEDIDEHELSVKVSLPHLKTLWVNVSDTVNVLSGAQPPHAPLLPHLTTPSLRELKVGDLSLETLPLDINNLIRRSSCSGTVQMLTLSYGGLLNTMDGLLTLMQNLKWVTDLTLEYLWCTGTDINSSNQLCRSLRLPLDNSLGSGAFFPNLEHIHLAGIDPDPAILITMLDSRIRKAPDNAALRSLRWDYSRAAEYTWCKSLMDKRYTRGQLRIEIRQDSEHVAWPYRLSAEL